jgi:hypothetical protein
MQRKTVVTDREMRMIMTFGKSYSQIYSPKTPIPKVSQETSKPNIPAQDYKTMGEVYLG